MQHWVGRLFFPVSAFCNPEPHNHYQQGKNKITINLCVDSIEAAVQHTWVAIGSFLCFWGGCCILQSRTAQPLSTRKNNKITRNLCIDGIDPPCNSRLIFSFFPMTAFCNPELLPLQGEKTKITINLCVNDSFFHLGWPQVHCVLQSGTAINKGKNKITINLCVNSIDHNCFFILQSRTVF